MPLPTTSNPGACADHGSGRGPVLSNRLVRQLHCRPAGTCRSTTRRVVVENVRVKVHEQWVLQGQGWSSGGCPAPPPLPQFRAFWREFPDLTSRSYICPPH